MPAVSKKIISSILFLLFAGFFCFMVQSADAVSWVPMNSEVAQEKGEEMFLWSYEYSSEPAILTCRADDFWKQLTVISFDVWSDRGGGVVLRLDQSDGKIFYSVFEPGEKWEHYEIYPDDLISFGGMKNEKLEPAKVERIFFADMNGPDHGNMGSRAVKFRNLALAGNTYAKNAENAENAEKGKEIEKKTVSGTVVLAFGSQGAPMDEDDFLELGTSAGRWCFVTDKDGSPLPMKIRVEKVQLGCKILQVPVISVVDAPEKFLEVLFWPVGNGFKLWLRAKISPWVTTQGQGVMLLNLELARTRLEKLVSRLGEDKVKGFSKRLTELENSLDPDDFQGVRLAALRADNLMEDLLLYSRDLVRKRSRDKVFERIRAGKRTLVPLEVAIEGTEKIPVEIKLEEPFFRIGVVESFGFTGLADKNRVRRIFRDLHLRGFNHVVIPLFWDKVIDDKGAFTSWEDGLCLPEVFSLGMTMQTHSVVQKNGPEFLKTAGIGVFQRSARKHLLRIYDRFSELYGSSLVLWEVVNEPSSHSFGGVGAAGRLELVRFLVSAHMKRSAAPTLVNDYDWERGLFAGIGWGDRLVVGLRSFHEKLLKQDPRPDVIGLEWYPGLRVKRPLFGFDLAEPCRDLLDTEEEWDRLLELGSSVMISESSVPGNMLNGDRNGFAWGPWDLRAQAAAAEDLFFLALSKPGMVGWVWWGITDREPWNREGGLYTRLGSEKPVLRALTSAIAKLREPAYGVMEPGGHILMPGLPGRYRITYKNRSWAAHVGREESVLPVP